MMLTELYYYYGNHPPAKVGSRPDFSFSPTTQSCAPPELAADELIDGLEAALPRVVTVLPAHGSPPLAVVARRSLTALRRARIAGRLPNVSDQVAREFRLRSDDLQSRSREQCIAFARQLAMYLCRRITGAPFESIGEHFNRNHSTVVNAYQLIERRVARDAAFRLFITKLEGRIAGTVPTAATPAV
jgi:chromosomal replication initiation ATPase DnaA